MAFINKPEDEEERLRAQAEGGQPQLAGEQGNLEGGGGMSGYTSPNKAGTSGFVDVHAYLDANKDQAVDTANKIGAKVGEQVEQTRGKVQTAEDAFNQRVNAGSVKNNVGLVDSAFKDPAGFVKDPNNVTGFKSMRDAIYGGPKSLEAIDEYSPASSAVSEGKRIASGINAPQGREELLYRVAKNPTKGNVSLDSLLIGGNQDARKTLEDSTKPFGEIDTYLNNASAGAKERAGAAEKETLEARDYAQSRLDAETNKFQGDLDTRLGAARTEAQKNADMLKAGIEGGNLTDSELQTAGMNRGQWDELLGTKKNLEQTGFWDGSPGYGQKFNLGDYYSATSPDTEITKENFASTDDYAKERALQTLADNGQFDALPDDASQAGKAPKNLTSYRGAEAYQNASGKLHALDDQFLAQYNDPHLVNRTEAEQRALLKDPFQAQAHQNFIDIVRRNPEKASAWQKGAADYFERLLGETNTLPGGGGGDAFDPNDVNGADGGFATNRIRTVKGEDGKSTQKWQNNDGQWVDIPTEYIYRDSSGKQTGPSVGSQPMRFNYNTGSYEVYGDVIKAGDAGGKDENGVNTGSKIPGVVRALGSVPPAATPTPQVNPGIAEPKPQVNPGIDPTWTGPAPRSTEEEQAALKKIMDAAIVKDKATEKATGKRISFRAF